MKVVNTEQITLTMTATTSQNATLATTVGNLSRSVVVIAGVEFSDLTGETAADKFEVDAWLSNASTVNVQRNAGTGTCTVTLHVIEFASSVAVQKGTFSMASATATDNQTITAVNQANAFAYFSCRMDETTPTANDDSDPDTALISLGISTTTNLLFTRAAGQGAVNGHWWVAEDAGATVTEESTEHNNNAATQVFSLGASRSVVLADTFLVSSQHSVETRYNDEARNDIRLSSATQLEMRDGYSTLEADTAKTFVIEDTALAVQHFQLSNVSAVSGTQAITSVDRTRSIILPCAHSGMATSSDFTDGNIDGRFIRFKFDSDTQVSWTRGQGLAATYMSFQVVEFEAGGGPPPSGRIMSSLAGGGGLASAGGLAGQQGGLAG